MMKLFVKLHKNYYYMVMQIDLNNIKYKHYFHLKNMHKSHI